MSEEHSSDSPAAPVEPSAVSPADQGVTPGAEATSPDAAPPAESPVASADGESPAAETPPESPPAEGGETPAEPALKPHTEDKGALLSEEPPKEQKDEKTEEKPKEGEEKPTQEEKPAEEVKYEFELPEGVQLQAEPLGKFTDFARENKFTAEVAQSLVGMHVEALQAYDAAALQRRHDEFLEMRRGWRNEIMADPELGGAGFRTNVNNGLQALERLVGEKDWPGFAKMLILTGATDHPAMLRLALSAHKKFALLDQEAEPVTATTPTSPMRVPAGPGGKGTIPAQGLAPRSGGRLQYTHDRSGGRNAGG